jgi:catalase
VLRSQPPAARVPVDRLNLRVVAEIALRTLQLNPSISAIQQALLDKHFLRKHGVNAYYVVPGMGNSPDKMLQARLISYPDAHRYRLGVNFEGLQVNRPKCPMHTYNRDGFMRFDKNCGEAPNYEPNSFSGPVEDPRYRELPYSP